MIDVITRITMSLEAARSHGVCERKGLIIFRRMIIKASLANRLGIRGPVL